MAIPLIADNKLICDCRLGWLFELRNRSKNARVHDILEHLTCVLFDKSSDDRSAGTQFGGDLDSGDRNRNRIGDDYFADEFSRRREDAAGTASGSVGSLFSVSMEELPCAQSLIDATDFPMSRESIGFRDIFSGTGCRRPSSTAINSVLLVMLMICFLLNC